MNFKKSALLLALCAVLALCGCVEVAEKQVDYTKYVTLGQYEGLPIAPLEASYTQADIDAAIKEALADFVTYEALTEGAQNGDVVVADFVGYVDGEPFENGSAENEEITLGAGGYIEGFEAGLIGAVAGTKLDVNVVFPDNYDEALAGKDAVFSFDIKEVKRPTYPEVTDDFVKANLTDYADAAAFNEAIKSQVETAKLSEAEDKRKSELWSSVVDGMQVISLPEDEMTAAKNEYIDYYKAIASYNNVSYEDLLGQYLNITEEAMALSAYEYAETKVKEDMVIRAIAQDKGYTVTAEELAAAEKVYMDYYGLTSTEDLYSYYTTEADMKISVLYEKVLALVLNSAVETE